MFWIIFAALFGPASLRMTYYPLSTVEVFIEQMRDSDDVSLKCRKSLSILSLFLSSDHANKRNFYFYRAFGNGDAKFITEDRWAFNMHSCLKSAGETASSRSEYPTQFCYGKDEQCREHNAFGICIPSTCELDVNELLRQWQEFSSNCSSSSAQKFVDVQCLESRKKVQWTENGGVVCELAVNMIAILIVGISTAFHCVRGELSRSLGLRVLLAFSIKKNGRRLFAMPKEGSANISCISGLRFLSMLWVVIGHSFAWIQGYLTNPEELRRDLSSSFLDQWITNHSLAVENFFVMSATLTAYSWFRRIAKRKEAQSEIYTMSYWLKFYRHRLIRLLPAYLYTLSTMTFKSTTHNYQSAWPPTDPYVQCRAHWWQNVLLVNSFTNADCLGWTWYISAEFIFYLMSPAFLLALHISEPLGYALSTAVMAGSAFLNALHIYRNHYPPTPLTWARPDTFSVGYYEQVIEMYIRPQYRIGAYLVGILLGHTLAKGNSHWQPVNVGQLGVAWLLCVVCATGSLFGLYPAIQGWRAPVYNAIFGGIFRVLWSVAVAWLIYACHNHYAPIVNKFLSSRIFLPFSALCYSVYLVHMAHVVSVFEAANFPITYSGRSQFVLFIALSVVLSYFFGSFGAFVAEFPAINIEALLFDDKRKGLSPVGERALAPSTDTAGHVSQQPLLYSNSAKTYTSQRSRMSDK